MTFKTIVELLEKEMNEERIFIGYKKGGKLFSEELTLPYKDLKQESLMRGAYQGIKYEDDPANKILLESIKVLRLTLLAEEVGPENVISAITEMAKKFFEEAKTEKEKLIAKK